MASSSYNQAFSTSASISPPTSWDVFISFRGIDTRFKFTSHLYAALDRHAVQTFKDDVMLSTGELISDSWLQPIQKSKTYIVVFSENYASSRWCLDDLVEILKCCETMQRSVIPVFYNIDPSVVRYQTGSFNEAFEKHETRYDMDILAKWRATLTKVGDFSGYHVRKNMSEADIINKVVDRVLLEINPMTLDVAEYPVGLDSRVKSITSLLSCPIDGVLRFGIYGMGGVGKTTLAKAVYNHNYYRFQGSCFLANVREVLGTGEGLECLQQQLMNDVLKCKNIKISSVDQGIELIRARICSMKVLIVIDDLDDPKQMDFLEGPFALGSIIIITTRNEDLLDSIEVDVRYKVNELGDADSHQLFSRHAFGDTKISATYMELSKDILEYARGLPLALKILGSNLRESQEGCICIDKLKRDSLDDVEKTLLISFDALKLVDPMLQDIFLDIACFFTEQKKKEVVHILETCYLFVNHYIDILKKRCLLTINDQDELGMHVLLRDMGRKIASNNSPDEPGIHSRLWASTDISYVLKNHKGTKMIEGIIPHNRHCQNGLEEISFDAEAFKRMSRLRFLYLENVKLSGSFEHAFEDLRFLCWECCPLECLPSEFYPIKLVTLSLPRSNLRTMWQLNMIPRAFEKLKTLNMSDSKDLTTTPDFTKLPSLETLNLERCERLEEVHISIGSLVRLVYFSLCGCVKLRSLPDSICNLRTLKSLSIVGCRMMEALPIEMGNIESLKELNAEKLSALWNLPDSIGHLSKLVELRLSYSYRLKILPDTICNLRTLKILDIGYCRDLEALPTEFGNIGSLEELNAEGLSVSKLPDSIGRLSKLVKLKLNNNMELQTLPNTICNLRQLKVLNIGCCRSLKALPTEFGNIESLEELNAEGLTVLKLPDSIGCLYNLVELNLNSNLKLQTLPNTICNLRALEVLNVKSCASLDALPRDFGDIESLKVLNAEWLSISKLPDSIGRLSKLAEVRLSFNRKLITLPDSICNLRALEVLHIVHCSSLEMLPLELGAIESLKELKAEGRSAVWKLPDSIGHLSKLVELTFSHNNKLKILPDTICKLSALEVLNISGCTKLERLPDQLWKLTRLTELKASDTYLLKKLPDIKSSQIALSLKMLDLSESGLSALPSGISQLSNLEYLNLRSCCHLLLIAELPLNLKQLMADDCTSLKSIPNLTNFKQLEILGLSSCSGLREIQGMEELTSIRSLYLGGCNSSLLASTFTDYFFQMYTGFGRVIEIYATAAELNLVHQRSNLDPAGEISNERKPLTKKKKSNERKPKYVDNIYVGDLQPKAGRNFLAMILFFTPLRISSNFRVSYHVNTSTSYFKGKERGVDTPYRRGSVMVIVPRSIFLIKDDDSRIEVTIKDGKILGIHLLYKQSFNSSLLTRTALSMQKMKEATLG